jgi:preprotein translocase subunit YajC
MSSPPILMSMVQAAPSTGVPAAAWINFMMPMVLILGIFWILVWRPQQRQMKAHKESIAAVKKGDEVITGGGIRGRVTKVGDEEAEVEIAQGVKIKVVKSTISQVLTASAKPAND